MERIEITVRRLSIHRNKRSSVLLKHDLGESKIFLKEDGKKQMAFCPGNNLIGYFNILAPLGEGTNYIDLVRIETTDGRIVYETKKE